MFTWISEIWVKLIKKKPSLLFLDTFSAHLTDQVKTTAFEQSNTTVIVLQSYNHLVLVLTNL